MWVVAVADVAGRGVAGRRQRVAGHGRAVAGVGLARGRHGAAAAPAAARTRRAALRRAGRCEPRPRPPSHPRTEHLRTLTITRSVLISSGQ